MRKHQREMASIEQIHIHCFYNGVRIKQSKVFIDQRINNPQIQELTCYIEASSESRHWGIDRQQVTDLSFSISEAIKEYKKG